MSEMDPRMNDEIAAGERWLSGFPDPSPSPEASERTKRAVQDELTRLRTARSAARHWTAWRGVLAAAASIALAVTIGWYSFETHQRSTTAAAKMEPLTVWSTETQEEVTRFAGMDESLSDLEAWSADQAWAANGASMYDALEGVLGDEAKKGGDDTGALMVPSNGPRPVGAMT